MKCDRFEKARMGRFILMTAMAMMSLSLSVFGTPVTREQAQKAADTFLSGEKARWQKHADLAAEAPAKRQAVQSASISNVGEVQDKDGRVLAYIQELQPEGYIIVAADDTIKPILGFSFEGTFPYDDSGNNALLHLVQWDVTARLKAVEVVKAKTTVLGQVSKEALQWNNYVGGDAAIAQAAAATQQWPADRDGWLTTSWYQTSPYNDMCPNYSATVSLHCLVGCTATAFSQIINYWKYPQSVSFSSADAYTSKGDVGSVAIDADHSSRGFPSFAELSNSLATITYGGSDTEVANLCFAAGVKLKMQYGYWASSAPLSDGAYKDGFSYGSARKSYAWGLVRDKVIQNMKDGWPAQIGIFAFILDWPPIAGHSVVVDGYRSDDYFHVNLGWLGVSLASTWYNLPSMDTRPLGGDKYSLILQTVYDIAPYRGWYQVGADERNSYGTIYSGPSGSTSKWNISEPSGTRQLVTGILVGIGNRIYTVYNFNQDSTVKYSYVLVSDQYGNVINRIQIPDRNYEIGPPVMDSRGNIYVAGEQSYDPSSYNAYLYRIDPANSSVTRILTLPGGGDIAYHRLKIDNEDWIYVGTDAKIYCVDGNGNSKWSTPFTFPHSGTNYFEGVSMDRARQNVYIPYYDSGNKVSYLGCINRTTGLLRYERSFSNVPLAGNMTTTGSIGPDGTVYVYTVTRLYAIYPNASNTGFLDRWPGGVDPSNGGQGWYELAPSIGRDGVLYTAYWVSVNGVYKDAFAALNPQDGSKKWEKIIDPRNDYDNPFTGFVTGDGKVYFVTADGNSQTHLGVRMFAYQDNGSDATLLFTNTFAYGTDYREVAFGPGGTMYLPEGRTLRALAGGDVGDPDGAGMGFTNNQPPDEPSLISPTDGTTGAPVNVTLSWSCSDPLGHTLKYDVSLCPLIPDQEAVFAPVTNGLSSTSLNLTSLQPGVKYLWKVVATDGQTYSEGPTWAFSTAGCSYWIHPATTNVTEGGGSGGFTITATEGCTWSASSDATSWLHTSSSGSGNGTVNYTYDANSSTNSRIGHITVGDQTFTVTQAGSICSYSITPASASPGSGSGSGNFGVTAGNGCTWSASSDAASWLHTSSSGSGNGTVNYTYDANSSTNSRIGHVTVGGQTFTVTQAGGTCSYSINPVSASPGSGSGSGSFGVTTSNGCSWSASSDAPSWLHTSSSGSGNGTVNYTYDANSSTDPRIGHITVGGQTFTVNQASLSGGGGETNALTVAKLQAKLNFVKPNADSCSLKATFDPAPGFNPAGKTMTLDIGDAQVSFTLNRKGRGTGYQGTCRLTYNKRKGICTLTANLRRGDWQTSWGAYGLVDADVSPLGVPVKFPLLVVVGSEVFAAEKSLVYKAKPGKSGIAR